MASYRQESHWIYETFLLLVCKLSFRYFASEQSVGIIIVAARLNGGTGRKTLPEDLFMV